MTKIEYFHSGCDNKHAKFTMKNGQVIYGVVTTFFIEEPQTLYLVKSPQLIEYQKNSEQSNKTGMRSLATLFNIEEVEHVALFNHFEELLLKKKNESEEKKIDWIGRKNTWLKSINDLYENIDKWLKSHQENGLLEIKLGIKVHISEEYIGSYDAPVMEIIIGKDKIKLEPKGTLILGSYGRIDMKGPKGEIMIIEPEWNDWKFAQRSPKLQTWPIMSESFQEVLAKIIS